MTTRHLQYDDFTDAAGIAASRDLVRQLKQAVGARHVLTSPGATKPYRSGFRQEGGEAIAVVRPGSLVELWRAFQACVREDAVIIIQAANTGLTGGSTPDAEGYDRPVVILSTRRLDGIRLVRDGREAVCLPGASLDQLSRRLAPLRREPHSVLGSSCFGASVVGGVCNGSGGALVQRGPAYTELALFARVDEAGAIELVNHLGIDLGDDPETMLARLDRGKFSEDDVAGKGERAASARDYPSILRDIDAASPARFNADPRGLHETSGCAGRLLVFAVRVDTFPAPRETRTFVVGTNSSATLERVRRAILGEAETLPLEAEYLHSHAFDVADKYGKDMFLIARLFGAAWVAKVARWTTRLTQLGRMLRLPAAVSLDRLGHNVARLLPDHLPERLRDLRRCHEHLLIVKCADEGIEQVRTIFNRELAGAQIQLLECSKREAMAVLLHRFVVAAAAVRLKVVEGDMIGDLVALDVALRRNDREWFEQLPPSLAELFSHRIYYGHFLCHVLHQDYILRPGVSPVRAKRRLLTELDARGARYPAEHNVGHDYAACKELAAHFRTLDPGNRLNPGIGRTSKLRDWASAAEAR